MSRLYGFYEGICKRRRRACAADVWGDKRLVSRSHDRHDRVLQPVLPHRPGNVSGKEDHFITHI